MLWRMTAADNDLPFAAPDHDQPGHGDLVEKVPWPTVYFYLKTNLRLTFEYIIFKDFNDKIENNYNTDAISLIEGRFSKKEANEIMHMYCQK